MRPWRLRIEMFCDVYNLCRHSPTARGEADTQARSRKIMLPRGYNAAQAQQCNEVGHGDKKVLLSVDALLNRLLRIYPSYRYDLLWSFKGAFISG